jgi:hypothetical protein
LVFILGFTSKEERENLFSHTKFAERGLLPPIQNGVTAFNFFCVAVRPSPPTENLRQNNRIYATYYTPPAPPAGRSARITHTAHCGDTHRQRQLQAGVRVDS